MASEYVGEDRKWPARTGSGFQRQPSGSERRDLHEEKEEDEWAE